MQVGAVSATCRWCRRRFELQAGPGRPRQFCRRSCRQRDYEARERAQRHGLDERDLIVARHDLDSLRDDLFVLRCAVADVERDLSGGPVALREYREAISWLIEAARPLCRRAESE